MMKKFIVLALLGIFVAGCGQSAVQSEFWKHDTVYKNWDHMKYSWFGYRNSKGDNAAKSDEQGWWGIEIPYVPGEQTPSQ